MKICTVILGYICLHLVRGLLIRHSLEMYQKALCTNGQSASYFHSASGELEKSENVVIFLQPGGYCHNPYVCKMRCLVAPFMCEPPDEDTLENSHGILSDDPVANPHFNHYYKVVIPYCTADMYVGRRSASEETGGYSFLGRFILDAVVDSLKSTLKNVRNVVLAGSSAGGAGVAFNCDYIKTFYPTANIWCIVDGAFFYPIAEAFESKNSCETIDKVLKSATTFWNAPELDDFQLHSAWWLKIKQAVFISSAAVDQFGYESYCGQENNHTEMAIWSRGTQFMASVVNAKYSNLGFFMPSCYDHMLLLDPDMFNAVPVGRDFTTLSDLLGNWMEGSSGRAIQAWDQCNVQQVLCNRHCTNNLASYEDFKHV